MKELMLGWGLKLRQIRADLSMAGSPERCLSRMVAETDDGGRFVIERIARHQRGRRNEISAVLHSLRHMGLGSIQSYPPDAEGNHVHSYNGELWQIAPYIEGVLLSRPDYIHDGWRGEALAEFLVRMKRVSRGFTLEDSSSFSILRFITDLKDRMKIYNPEILTKIEEIIRVLFDEFAGYHDRLPVIFCHGDYHPLNVIWSSDGIACVIDWEFMGNKPEIFDAANLIGCIGMEEPQGLTGSMVRDFLCVLDKEGFLSNMSRKYLLEAVIAIRFAWLSEWLRKRDMEMVELEIVYLKLLVQNRNILKEAWEFREPVSSNL
jgi:homoserine kinase type II